MQEELMLFADYHQIHLFAEGASGDPADAWSSDAVDNRFGVAGGDTMVVATVRDQDVPVTVEVLDRAPGDDFALFDHVVEGSLRLDSGKIVVMGCTDYEPDARRFGLAAGWVRVRVGGSDLDAAAEAEFEDGPGERLTVQIWAAPFEPPAVLKRWVPSDVE